MRIACVQLATEDDREHRLERVLGLIGSLTEVDLVVLPELWPVGYFAFDDYADSAEDLSGHHVAALAAAARSLTSYLHAGSFVERDEHGKMFNTSVIFDPDGRIVHTYRKFHLFGYNSDEARLLSPGDRLETFRTEYGTMAAATCYDLRFPELFRILGERGAEVVLVTSAWPAERIEHWRILTKARAVENLCFLVACNTAGIDSGTPMGGHSVVVDPFGEVLAEAGDEETVLYASIDVPEVAKLRAEFPWLRDRRIEMRPDDYSV